MTVTIVPSVSSSENLEHLSTQVRRLWMREPKVDQAIRSDVLAELLDIELTLQRLTLRESWACLDPADVEQVATCRRRLAVLSDRWSPDS